MAQVRNTDRGIGSLQQVGIKTVLNLLLPAVGSKKTVGFGRGHSYLQLGINFKN
jgi:hypothetical protein